MVERDCDIDWSASRARVKVDEIEESSVDASVSCELGDMSNDGTLLSEVAPIAGTVAGVVPTAAVPRGSALYENCSGRWNTGSEKHLLAVRVGTLAATGGTGARGDADDSGETDDDVPVVNESDVPLLLVLLLSEMLAGAERAKSAEDASETETRFEVEDDVVIDRRSFDCDITGSEEHKRLFEHEVEVAVEEVIGTTAARKSSNQLSSARMVLLLECCSRALSTSCTVEARNNDNARSPYRT